MSINLGLGLQLRTTGGGSGIIVPPPLPSGASIAMLMDSQGARGASFTTVSVRTTAENRSNNELIHALARFPAGIHRNWWDPTSIAANRVPAWAEVMSAENHWSGLNLSASGDTSSGALRRVPYVIGTGADVCIVNIGTNVGPNNETAAETIANIQQIVADLVFANIYVVLGTIRPRRVRAAPTGSEISPSLRARILEINEAIRANWASWGAYCLWETVDAIIDPQYVPADDNYFSPLPEYVIADGVHLSPIGAWKTSFTLEACLRQIIQPGNWIDAMSPLNPNTDFSGPATGNASVGITTGIDGVSAKDCPDGFAILNPTGDGQPVTAESSVIGGEWFIDLKSAGGGAANTFQNIRCQLEASVTTGFTSTDWVVGAWEYEVIAPDANWVFLQATSGTGSTISARGFGQASGAFNTEPHPVRDNIMGGWITTEPLLVESRTSLQMRLDMAVRTDLAGEAQMKLKQGKLFLVSSPETDYPFDEGSPNGYYSVRPAGAGSTATTEVLGTGWEGTMQYVDIRISSITSGFEWGTVELLPVIENVTVGTLCDMTVNVKQLASSNLAFLAANMGVTQLTSAFLPVDSPAPNFDIFPPTSGDLSTAVFTNQFTLSGTDLTYGMPFLFFGSAEASPWSVDLRIHVETPIFTPP